MGPSGASWGVLRPLGASRTCPDIFSDDDGDDDDDHDNNDDGNDDDEDDVCIHNILRLRLCRRPLLL